MLCNYFQLYISAVLLNHPLHPCAGEKMALNIFEPRYRLMVRRCMEGSRRLGMAVVTTADGLHEVATECEIVECQPLPDGCAPLSRPVAWWRVRSQRGNKPLFRLQQRRLCI